MQFAFTDEQEQFRAVVRRFLSDKSPPTAVRRLMATAEGFDASVWRQLSDDLALPGIHIAEAYGGSGFGAVESSSKSRNGSARSGNIRRMSRGTLSPLRGSAPLRSS